MLPAQLGSQHEQEIHAISNLSCNMLITIPVQLWRILHECFATRDHPIKANDPPEEGNHRIKGFTSFGNTVGNTSNNQK